MFELYIAVTSKCNFQCSHCITSSSPKNSRWQLNNIEIESLAEIINKNSDIVCVHFSGGEPTIALKEILQLKQKISRQVEWAITTNGSLPKNKWDELLAVEFDYISVSFDLFHQQYINLETLLEFARFFRDRQSAVVFNVIFSNPRDLMIATPIRQSGFQVNFTKLVHGGNARKIEAEYYIEELEAQGCPSLRNPESTSTGAKKIIYLPGEGFTWCCGPLAFDKKAPKVALSQDYDLKSNELYQVMKSSPRFADILSAMKMNHGELKFASICDLCSAVFKPIECLSGLSLADLTVKKENNFFVDFQAGELTDFENETISKNFRISEFLTMDANAIAVDNENLNTNTIRVEEFGDNWISDATEFTKKNFYDLYLDHYTQDECRSELAGLESYFRKFNASGKVFLKNSHVVGLLLYNDYEKHPALGIPTRHIGYWGYDHKALTTSERSFIKQHWLISLKQELKGLEILDCSIHVFNSRSLKFAKSLGFTQRMWRFERRNQI